MNAPLQLIIVLVIAGLSYASYSRIIATNVGSELNVESDSLSVRTEQLGEPRTEQFVTYDSRPSPMNYTMGKYDGVRLTTRCPDKWKQPPCELVYHHPSRLSESLVQGWQAPDAKPPPSKFDHGPETPPVDGKKGSPRSKFMFAYNQCRPECCPSTYSCDHGCVCTSAAQRRWLERRGKNHSQEPW